MFSQPGLESDSNSSMFCGRLFHSFIVLGKNEN